MKTVLKIASGRRPATAGDRRNIRGFIVPFLVYKNNILTRLKVSATSL